MSQDKDNKPADGHEAELAETRLEIARCRDLYKEQTDVLAFYLAPRLTNLSLILRDSNQLKKAIDAIREAVELYHVLNKNNNKSSDADMVNSMLILCMMLCESGQIDETFQVGKNAVKTCLVLVDRGIYEDAGSFANILVGLSDQYQVLGSQEKALKATAEARKLYRDLYKCQPKIYMDPLASCLTDYLNLLSFFEKTYEDLTVAHEAIEVYRCLQASQPEEFTATLAAHLNNLGFHHYSSMQYKVALPCYQEAVQLHRDILIHKSDKFLVEYAICLRGLGFCLADSGKHADAIQILKEAAIIYRDLNANQANNFWSELNDCLTKLGLIYLYLNKDSDAIQLIQEAVNIGEYLHISNSQIIKTTLANNFVLLGICHEYQNEASKSLIATNKGVALLRDLWYEKPDYDISNEIALDLARGLMRLSKCYRYFGHREKALEIAEESTTMLRDLDAKKPAKFSSELVKSLNNLSACLSNLGQNEQAILIARNAITIIKKLNFDKIQNFRIDLAICLSNLGGKLNSSGRKVEALAVNLEAVENFCALNIEQPENFSGNYAQSLNNLSVSFRALGEIEQAMNAAIDAESLYRLIRQNHPGKFAMDMAMTLANQSLLFTQLSEYKAGLNKAQEAVNILTAHQMGGTEEILATCLHCSGANLILLGRPEEAQAAFHEAGLLLARQSSMDPHRWCQLLTNVAPELDSAQSLREVHLAVIKRIADLRRLSHFDASAGSVFIELQAMLSADLWGKLQAASEHDPSLMDEALAVLISAIQSPDLARWIADNQRSTPEGLALAHAEDEMRQAQDTLSSLIKRLRGDGGNEGPLDLPGGGLMRQAPSNEESAALASQIELARTREAASRAALKTAQNALAQIDPAFASAYEVPSVGELRAMLDHLRKATSVHNANPDDSAALLCFLELPATDGQDARLVGVLLSSGQAKTAPIEFPGLLALAQKFQDYKPAGQRSSAAVRRHSETPEIEEEVEAKTEASDQSQANDSAPAVSDFDALFHELERLWWAPVKRALAANLLDLKVLHVCSLGMAHQLPFSQVSYLQPGGNVKLFQWPGLPYLRLAYRQQQAKEHSQAPSQLLMQPKSSSTGPSWQIGHDCAWGESTPLPMVAVEANLLLGIIAAAGQTCQAVDDPAQLLTQARGLVVCSHGSKAQGVNSAVHLPNGKLTTGEVMRRQIGPEIALIPACHAADTADDHANNALGVAAGFLLAGSKVVVGSTKAVPDTLMPWFSTLVLWYAEHEGLDLYAAAVRARQDFGKGEFAQSYQAWMKTNLAAALATLHPGGQEAQRMGGDKLLMRHLLQMIQFWPFEGMNRDALIAKDPIDLPHMQALCQAVADKAFTHADPTPQRMREMSAFLVVFGLG